MYKEEAHFTDRGERIRNHQGEGNGYLLVAE